MSDKNTKSTTILASQSTFRAQLLSRLSIDFIQVSANVDETEHANEAPQHLTRRLAVLKAQSIFDHFTVNLGQNSIVIGSDQIACHQDKILGKPHTRDKAIAQLLRFSEQRVDFYTSVCVLSSSGKYEHTDITSVYFKKLTQQAIENYVDNEDVLNCAGSFKSEGLGICLFDKIVNEDPTALIGLPMIWLANCLQELQVQMPSEKQ